MRKRKDLQEKAQPWDILPKTAAFIALIFRKEEAALLAVEKRNAARRCSFCKNQQPTPQRSLILDGGKSASWQGVQY